MTEREQAIIQNAVIAGYSLIGDVLGLGKEFQAAATAFAEQVVADVALALAAGRD